VTIGSGALNETGLVELTELPVPTSVPDLLNSAASILEHSVNASIAVDESEPEDDTLADVFDDGFGAGEIHESDTASLVEELSAPSTGWTRQQELNLSAEIHSAVFRYERNWTRGSQPWETGIMAQVFRCSRVKSFIDSPMGSVKRSEVELVSKVSWINIVTYTHQ
jgi:hypothetical protein